MQAAKKANQPASKRVKHGRRQRQDSVVVNGTSNGIGSSSEAVPASPEKAARRFVTSPEFLTGTNLYEYQLEVCILKSAFIHHITKLLLSIF